MPPSNYFAERWLVTAWLFIEATARVALNQSVLLVTPGASYVPIRMPDTICVQERLPPGAAAVLINRTHTYRDLVMPIDHAEKCWLDAIDGTRCIGEIWEERSPAWQPKPQIEMARAFFERLWWYDQVVFHAPR